MFGIRVCVGATALLLAFTRADAVIVDRIAASVNDIAIPESEVRRAIAITPMAREPGETDAAFRTRVLDALIDEKLEYEDAQRFGPAPPDAADVEAAMKRLRERLAREGKNPDAEFSSAGLSAEEVRASLEKQLLIRRYLQERFRPIAFADEDRAREEYEKVFVPERRAAGEAVPSFESVAEEMRSRSQQRVFDQEVEKWLKELRQKARITVYPTDSPPASGTPRPLAAPAPPPTPATPSPKSEVLSAKSEPQDLGRTCPVPRHM